MTDKNRKIILSLQLNFVARSKLDGTKINLIIGKAVSFFDQGTIISAKEFSNQELNIQSRCVKHTKDEDSAESPECSKSTLSRVKTWISS